MANYNKSDYARNKDEDSIVYQSWKDGRIEITEEIYLEKCPERTSEDFRQLKEISDEMYHDETKGERNHRRAYKNSKNIENCTTDSHEDELIAQEEKEEIIALVQDLIDKSKMSPIQRRRFMKYYGHGKNLRVIA